ncbi:MFS transporter [Azospirillum sp. A1-3]|uniref:MFS transporter n=1 Tax=Azospirillum sp. A1-3 TaxID=185874 RepID=UPI0020776BFB|nr:MFS transporter [Azospirillum sp. A1-3]MCM8735528.1 MFS transporter [Azospirillum sp. A1-3]
MTTTSDERGQRTSLRNFGGAGAGRKSTDKATGKDSHRWKVLGVGVAANGSFAAALTGLPATAVSMRADYGLAATDLGLVIGVMGLGVAGSELLWGMLTDWWGDRKVLLTGLGLTGMVLALMALLVSPVPGHIPSTMLLAGAFLLVGMIGGSLNGSSGRAVMAWFGEGERGFAMSVRQMALPAGGAAGALILPPLAEGVGFQGVYGTLAALCLITTGFVWLWVSEPPVMAAKMTAGTASQISGKGPLRNGQVWKTVFGIGALCIPQVAVVTFAAIFLNDVGHLGTAAVSASIVAIQLGAAVVRVWSGHFTDRRGNRRPFLKACALLTAVVYCVLAGFVAIDSALPEPGGAFVVAVVVALVAGGVVASSWHGIAFTELASIAGIANTGTALGLGNTFAFGAYFLAPLAIPHVLERANWSGVWLAAAVAALAAFILFPKVAPVEKR